MLNTNPETGVRYGVIALNSLDPDLAQELLYGPGATDLTYRATYEDANARACRDWEDALQQAEIAAAEADYHMPEPERESFIETWIFQHHAATDEDDFIRLKLEEFSSIFQSKEPTIEGTYEGVKYRISWLGGAPHLWVLNGPIGEANSLCGPCIPNAGDLDSGFKAGFFNEGGFPCYVVPNDWLQKGE